MSPFSAVTNLVVSRDGGALQPAPGLRVSGRPFYGQQFAVSGAPTVGASSTTIVVDASADAAGNAWLPSTFAVYVPADGEIYLATRTAAATFTIPTITSAVDDGDPILVQRKFRVHDLAAVDGSAAAVLETRTFRNVVTEMRNLATAVCSGPLSITDPPGPGIRDETDAGFVLWPSPTMAPVNVTDYGHDTSFSVYLRNYEITRRMQADVLNGRVLIAVPGLGIMFEADVRRAREWLPRDLTIATWHPDVRWTKMLGIPRGITEFSPVTLDTGGGLTSGSWYAVAVAYYDPFSDMVGLLSPVRAVEMTGGNTSFDFNVLRPRGAMWEAIGLQAILYLAGPFDTEGDALAAVVEPKLFSVGGPFRTADDNSSMDAAFADSWLTFTVVTQPDDLRTIRPFRIGEIEVAPTGASWCRAVRGVLVYGAERPRWWEFQAWPARLAPATAENNEFFLVQPQEHGFDAFTQGPAALNRIPSGYAGRFVSEVAFASATNMGRMVSTHHPAKNSLGPGCIKLDFDAGDEAAPDAGNLKTYRIFGRQQGIRFCEADAPGVSPAINEIPLDSLRDPITTGCARVGDQILGFSRSATVLIGWAGQPRASGVQVLSNRFGCVAPNSIVEFPGGAAWLSAFGPCRFGGGGVDWIGWQLGSIWDEFLRDSEGMLACAGAAVDESRNAVFWALRRSTDGEWDTATDDTDRSKALCDTVLAWNWVTNAFSLIEMNEDVEAFGSLPLDTGDYQPAIASAASSLTSDAYAPILSFDGVLMRRPAVLTFSTAAHRDPSTAVFACSGADGNVVVNDWAFIRTANGETLRYWGAVSAVNSGGVTLNDADGFGWMPNDVLVVGGPRHATVTTHRYPMGVANRSGSVRSIVIEATVASGAHVYVIAEASGDGGTAVRWNPLRIRDGVTELVGDSFGAHVEVTLTIVADASYVIRDIVLEVQSANA